VAKRTPDGDVVGGNSRNKAPRYNGARFVNRELSEDEVKALKKLPSWGEDWDNLLLQAMEQRYKITLKFDDWSKSFAAFMTTDDEKADNFGMILTGRGSMPIKALRQVLYKHFSLAADQLWVSLDRQFAQEIDD
jgi:hypothetical protein